VTYLLPFLNFNSSYSNGLCPIHIAAERGHNDAVEELVRLGCNVDVKAVDGTTALMLAAKSGQLSTIRLLFCLGASLVSCDRAGVTAAHLAAQGDHGEVIHMLAELLSQAKTAMAKILEARALDDRLKSKKTPSVATAAAAPANDTAVIADTTSSKSAKGVTFLPSKHYF